VLAEANRIGLASLFGPLLARLADRPQPAGGVWLRDFLPFNAENKQRGPAAARRG
jgi:hypothetical protein